ncbi:MAG TPA: LLM class flavin-dependent oxidoreductase [Pseudonocardia sp.]|uniref:LLM class flavin-dependent oxidoreductase n=1 Tax=Pseudonocardia sp. TaxID=60912 RepID=UPI002ED99EFF
MDLGYLTHVADYAPPAEVYRDTIELAVAAETLGFSSFWVAQHHTRALRGVLPSPLVLLAAVSRHTSTIRLGTAVVVAPLEHPRRLAEDAGVLDLLAEGRLQLGLGAGSDAASTAAFGLDHASRHARCREVIDELRALLTDDEHLASAGDLRNRLWWATGSRAGVDAAAARGMGVISGRPVDAEGSTVREDLARYWASAVERPRVAVSRVARAGTPATDLLARWRSDPALHWATELIVQTQPTRSGLDVQLPMLRMLASEVAPVIRALAPHSRLVLT